MMELDRIRTTFLAARSPEADCLIWMQPPGSTAVKFINLAAHFRDGNVAIKAPDQLRRAVKKLAGVAKDWSVPIGVNPSPAALLSGLLLTLKKSESFHRFTGSFETSRVAAEAPLLPRSDLWTQVAAGGNLGSA
jgi:hypothetical protein